MNKINYQKKLDEVITQLGNENRRKVLVLHGCCAPCSSYCLEYLGQYFDIKLLYYNPNISSQEEYDKRLAEVHRFVDEFLSYVNSNEQFKTEISSDDECTDSSYVNYNIEVIDTKYIPSEFYEAVRGYENCEEGGKRCHICYELRMREAALYAKQIGADYFTTTLSISPLKNSSVINEIGQRLATELGIEHLPSDFKKKEGYKRSIELSKEYNLYRQNYCGCAFSKRSAEKENI